MKQTGIGFNINFLFGDHEAALAVLEAAKDKPIKKIWTDDVRRPDGSIALRFEDGTGVEFYDNGRSCCESRYLTTDDDLDSFAGSTFEGIDIKDAPSVEDEYGVHEVQFFEINTSLGVIVCETHNDHNGYYGGVWMTCEALPMEEGE